MKRIGKGIWMNWMSEALWKPQQGTVWKKAKAHTKKKLFIHQPKEESFSKVVKKLSFLISSFMFFSVKILRKSKFPLLIQNENFVTPQLILCKIARLNELIPHGEKFLSQKKNVRGLLVKEPDWKDWRKIISEIKLIFELKLYIQPEARNLSTSAHFHYLHF